MKAEYYKKLSERLKDIIRRHGEKWDELVQLLLDFRNDIEKERKQGAEEAGLTETEYAFFNILLAELEGEETIDETKVKDVVSIHCSNAGRSNTDS